MRLRQLFIKRDTEKDTIEDKEKEIKTLIAISF